MHTLLCREELRGMISLPGESTVGFPFFMEDDK